MTLPEIPENELGVYRNLDESSKRIFNALNYLRANDLYYGAEHRNRDDIQRYDAEWMIAETPFYISREEERVLKEQLPEAIQDFHHVSASLIRTAFTEDSPVAEKIKTRILSGYDESIREYYQRIYSHILKSGLEILPMSSRPDVQLVDSPNGRQFKIIEYNTDGRADKGNTLGVSEYNSQIFGNNGHGEIAGAGLAQSFIDTLERQYPEQVINVVTVTPKGYREEYNSQNRFFASKLDEVSKNKQSNINWTHASIDDLQITDEGVFLPDGTKVDLIDREFELQGFAPQDMRDECELVEAYLESKVDLLGSLLPHNDKVMMSFLFDPELDGELLSILGGDVQKLHNLRNFHAETYHIDDVKHIEEVKDGLVPMVLKMHGNSLATTGAAGIVISEDDHKVWRQSFDQAVDKGTYVVQRFYPSFEASVSGRRSHRGTPKTNPNAKFRFAPYYVNNKAANKMVLGDILVTAGIYPKVTKMREKNIIHSNRESAYMSVFVND